MNLIPTSLQEWAWIAAIAAPSGLLYAIATGIPRRIWRYLSAPVKAHFAGVRQMVSDVSAMKSELAVVKGEVTAIKTRVDAELGPNGGSSMRDAVSRIAAWQAAILDQQPKPMFSTDTNGRFIEVNRPFEVLTGYASVDLYGMGWVNVIHQDDQEMFMTFWLHALKDQRIARRALRLETSDGRIVPVSIEAKPMRPYPKAASLGLFGTVDVESAA